MSANSASAPERDAGTPLLAVSGLSIRTRSGAPLVSELSFTLEAGRRLALIGESGSGKSLTGLAIIGLLPETLEVGGSVRLGGHEIVGTPERRLNRLRGRVASVVFQEPLTALDPLMRLGDQLAEPLRRAARRRGAKPDRATTRAAVLRALDDVSIAEPERIARSWPHEVSGGQRQRVAIAMALASEPALLIADEPTTALDVTVQRDILTLLDRAVAERGTALLFISHDLGVVARMAPEAVVLERGHAVEAGPIRALVNEPRSAYTQQLVAAARSLDAALDFAGAPARATPSVSAPSEEDR